MEYPDTGRHTVLLLPVGSLAYGGDGTGLSVEFPFCSILLSCPPEFPGSKAQNILPAVFDSSGSSFRLRFDYAGGYFDGDKIPPNLFYS